MFGTDASRGPFHPGRVESVDVEPADMEGRPYSSVFTLFIKATYLKKKKKIVEVIICHPSKNPWNINKNLK